MGFKYCGISNPNYKWVKDDIVLNRYKTALSRLIDDYSEYENTENEIMSNLGYLKIYDCGNYRYIYSVGNKEV
ncbi:MAG: hypothetical protein IJ593_11050 [Lachnospiraceae bacterium]|nr:hypothetical protein [Lachnospiraceae bacterium]